MPTILVVDDSPVDRRLIAGVLQKSPVLRVETATDGADALRKMPTVDPDLIVTDLTMPEMDGLQLVTAVRIHHPRVPVVLVTAHGSEALAVQALEQGAASYVPKAQLAQKLLDVVEHVLVRASADETYERLTSCMTQADFRFQLASDPGVFERLVDLVQSITVSMQLCDPSEQVRLGMALEEALTAAAFHGNLELTPNELFEARLNGDEGLRRIEERRNLAPYCDRHVDVRLELTPLEGRFTITHQGPPQEVKPQLLHVEGLALDDAASRTAILLQAMMDEVRYSNEGRTLVLIKRRRPPQESSRD